MTPTNNDAFLREVDEELRRDQITGFWKTYGKWVAIVLVVGLALFAGYLWYAHQQRQQAGVDGEKMAAALDQLTANQDAKAKPALDALAGSKRPGYAASARLALADLAMQKNDLKGAANQYKAIAADASIAQPFRDLALVRQTAAEFDLIPPAEVVSRLKGLAVTGSPWLGSAGEMVAVSYLRQNNRAAAGAMFALVAGDQGVPRSIRSRAVQMAGILGVDAVAPASAGGDPVAPTSGSAVK